MLESEDALQIVRADLANLVVAAGRENPGDLEVAIYSSKLLLHRAIKHVCSLVGNKQHTHTHTPPSLYMQQLEA